MTTGFFKSPFCAHEIALSEFDYANWVTCECGNKYNALTVRAFLTQKQATDTAYFAFERERKLYDKLYETLKSETTGATAVPAAARATTAASTTATAAPVSAPVSAAAPVPAEPVAPPAPKMHRPKRAPFSPRTLMLLVAGLLAVVGVSIFAVSVHDVVIGSTVVGTFALALGYGGYRAHKLIRGLGNFLTALASSIVGLGLFALANLYIPWRDAGFNDAYHSPYLLLSALGTTALSLFLGWRFKIAGWFALGPIGLGISMLIAVFALIPGSLSAAGVSQTDAFAWTIVGASVFTLLIGATSPLLRLSIPEFKDPSDEEKFLVLDMTRERLFARQSVLMAMIVSAGLLTVRYAQVLFGSLTGSRPFGPLPVAPVLVTGLLWLGAAVVIDRIGHRFTTSGEPNRILQRGGWILGFANLAMVAGKLAGDLNGYLGVALSSILALAFLLLPRYVGAIRNSGDTALATAIAGWTTWLVWFTSSPGIFLDGVTGVRLLSVQLAVMALVWLAVRFAYGTASHQRTALTLAGLSGILLVVIPGTGSGMVADLLSATATLIAAVLLVTALTFANSWINRRHDYALTPTAAAFSVLSHGLVAMVTFVNLTQLAHTWTSQSSFSVLILVGGALLAAAIRFATGRKSQGSGFGTSAEWAVWPYVALALAGPLVAPSAGNFTATYSITFAAAAAFWLAFRYIAATAKNQFTIIVLAGLCAMLIPVASATGGGMGADLWQASGLLLTAAVVVTLITLANQLVNSRQGIDAAVNLPLVGTLSHLAVVASSFIAIANLATDWKTPNAYLTLPLIATALLISALRFASTARMSDNNPLFASVKVGTAPYLALALLVPLLGTPTPGNLPETYSIAVLLTTLTVVGFATLRRVASYGIFGIALTFALSVVVDYTVQHLVGDGKTVLPFAVGIGVFVASFVGIYVSYAKRLPTISEALGRLTPALFGGFSLIHSILVNVGHRPGDWLVWVDSLTLVVIGAAALTFSRSRGVSAMPGLSVGAVHTGWLTLAMSEVAAFATIGTSGTVARVLVINAIAVAAILVSRRNQLGAATNTVIYFATRAELLLLVAFAYLSLPAALGSGPLLPFAALALSYATDWALERFAGVNLGWPAKTAMLAATLLLALPQVGFTLSAFDGRQLSVDPNPDWFVATIALTAASTIALLWRHIRAQSGIRPFGEVLIAWVYGFMLIATSAHSHLESPYTWIELLGLLGALLLTESYFAKRQLTALVGFVPVMTASWLAVQQLANLWHIGLSSPQSLVSVAAFVLSTRLARREDGRQMPSFWAYVLPATSVVGYTIGLSYARASGSVTTAALVIDAVLGLILAVAYLRLSHSSLWDYLTNIRGSLLAAAAVNWGFGLVSIAETNNYGAMFAYLAASTAILVWYGLVYGSRIAIFTIYGAGVVLAIDGDVAFGSAVRPSGFELEFATAILALVTALATFVLEAKLTRLKGTLIRWAIPLGIVLVPSACYTIATSAVSFANQSTSDIARFIAVSVVSIVGVLLGIRIGNRGITTATTTSLMLALVPGIWFRIAEITTNPSITAETRALLVAVTVYALVYIYRKNTHVSLPSLVIWGIPVVISLSVTFIDAMNAVHRTLTAEDWIRFAILMGAGALFLVVGAMRRIAGMFYPGLFTVVVSVIPYAWSNGGYLFPVLLVISGLIVWAAIRLDRFSGWLKALD